MISDALGVGLEAVDSGKFATVFRIGLRFTHWRFGSEANARGCHVRNFTKTKRVNYIGIFNVLI